MIILLLVELLIAERVCYAYNRLINSLPMPTENVSPSPAIVCCMLFAIDCRLPLAHILLFLIKLEFSLPCLSTVRKVIAEPIVMRNKILARKFTTLLTFILHK